VAERRGEGWPCELELSWCEAGGSCTRFSLPGLFRRSVGGWHIAGWLPVRPASRSHVRRAVGCRNLQVTVSTGGTRQHAGRQSRHSINAIS
jgi:hypothetical protein